MLMIDKKTYVNDIKIKIQQLQKEQDQLFQNMIKELEVSKEDVDYFFDYCYNDYEFKHGMEMMRKYL